MIIEKLEELKKSRIKMWPVRSNRASEIGHPCIRYLVFMRTRWEERPLHGVKLQGIFDMGNILESATIREMMDAGLQVIEQQRGFEWKQYEITGHIDCKILEDGYAAPTEIKSASQFSFDKINSINDLVYGKYLYLRKYPTQLNTYLLMDEKEWGLFLFRNKTTGEYKEIRMNLDYDLGEQTLKKCEAVNNHVDEETVPDCIPYDDMICGQCGFLQICLPEIKRDALEFTVDPEMESKIDRWFELKDSKSEYASLDKYIKETFREKEKIVVGNYLITGSFTTDKKWKCKIQNLEVKP